MFSRSLVTTHTSPCAAVTFLSVQKLKLSTLYDTLNWKRLSFYTIFTINKTHTVEKNTSFQISTNIYLNLRLTLPMSLMTSLVRQRIARPAQLISM